MLCLVLMTFSGQPNFGFGFGWMWWSAHSLATKNSSKSVSWGGQTQGIIDWWLRLRDNQQWRSQNLYVGAKRSAKGAEIKRGMGRIRGLSPPQLTRGPEERSEIPQQGPGRAPAENAFGYFNLKEHIWWHHCLTISRRQKAERDLSVNYCN